MKSIDNLLPKRSISPFGAMATIALVGLSHATPTLAASSDQRENESSCESWERCHGTYNEIKVTGSRIQLPALEDKEPTVYLNSKYLEDRGLTNIADALNETPGIRGSITPAGSQPQFGQGVNFINIYGLGSNRTLTLVNGRRVVSSNVPSIFGHTEPGSQVDLNIFPAILIDRVERISGGGAPVYGTDAVAGTVNIILKDELNGLELRGSTGITGEGDNFRYSIQAASGFNFADGRGKVIIAGNYDKVEGVLFNARGFYRANVGTAINPCSTFGPGQTCTSAGNPNLVANLGFARRTPLNDGRINPGIGFNNSPVDGQPGSILISNLTLPSMSRSGVISSGPQAYNYQFDAKGNLVPFDRGIPYVVALPNPAAIASGGDGFALNDYSQITSDLDRFSTNLLFSLQLNDNFRFFAEGIFYVGKANELVQQPTFNATAFTRLSGPLTFRVDHPLLTQQAKEKLASLGYTSTFQLSRANADLADLTGSSESRLYRGLLGLEGELNIAGRNYNFETYINYGRNDTTEFGQNINQQNFINAINVQMLDGKIICSTVPTVIGTKPTVDPNCKPLNLFGQGAPSAESLSYILQNTVSRSRIDQLVINANAGGSPFDFLGNSVRFNIGLEHHREKAAFRPDAFLVQGLGRSAAIAPTSGRYQLTEGFGEVLLPIIQPENNFIFEKLEAFGRFRHVRKSMNGQANAWALGGSFAPIADLEFRGSHTRSFRAPSILELFAPRNNVTTGVPDLCSPASIGAGPVPAIRKANCEAFLARYPKATPLIAATSSLPSLNGGNPKLQDETANSFTFGAIFQPRFLPGFTASVDYVNINIVDPIANLTVANIVQACFDNQDFDKSDPANGNAFCSLIKREPDGQVINNAAAPGIVSGYVNGKQIKMDAIQAAATYSTDVAVLGLRRRLELSANLFHLRNRLVNITGVAPTQSEGVIGDPKWQGQLRMRFHDNFGGASFHINYTGKQWVSYSNRGPAPNEFLEFNHFKPFISIDSSIWIHAAANLRLSLSITNLTNRRGQKYGAYYIPFSINDALGRRMTMSLRQQF